jgi:outer membrane protein assembly factor BamB
VPLGEGYSGISVVGDQLFTLYADAEGELLAAFDRNTGESRWTTRIADRLDTAMGNGPRSTPTVADGRVFALGAKGDLVAAKASDGTILWRHNLPERFGSRPPQWGFASAPLVDGDLLLIEVGGTDGAFAALDPATGEVRWQVYERGGGYSSPIVMTIGGVKQYVFVPTSADQVVSLLPDGTVHWTHSWHAGTIAMPVAVGDDGLFVSASNDIGAMVVKISESTDGVEIEELWRSREMKNHFSSSVYYQGHIYGFDGGTFKCIDALTGEFRWGKRGLGKGSLIVTGDRLIVLGDRGQLVLVEATAEAYRELATAQVMGGKTWTSPAFAGGQLFLRNQEEMVALDLDAPPAEQPSAEPASQESGGAR